MLTTSNRVGRRAVWTDVAVETTFAAARSALRARPPALLVTSVALREYNGLHLVYLAKSIALETRSIVHTARPDTVHAGEVRAAGAFYELQGRLASALPAYLAATLPARDRRVNVGDRRGVQRPAGGRRAVDRRLAV